MKKEAHSPNWIIISIIALVAIVAIVVLFYVVGDKGAGAGQASLVKRTLQASLVKRTLASPTVSPCTDPDWIITDASYQFMVRTTASGINGEGTDRCYDAYRVLEYYCGSDGKIYTSIGYCPYYGLNMKCIQERGACGYS